MEDENHLRFFVRPPAGWMHSHAPQIEIGEYDAWLPEPTTFTTRGYDLIVSIGDARCDVVTHPAFRHAFLRLENGEQDC